MQATSPAFAPYADIRHCNIGVSFRLADNTAAADATATATGQNPAITQLAQTHDEIDSMTAKYAMLETGGWPLDGTCYILPDSVEGIQTGFWSNLSGADGTFEVEPTLTFDFAADHSSIGFTVMFDDKANWYPKNMTVTVYNAVGAILGAAAMQVTSARQIVDLPIENYRKVVVTFPETRSPYQRVRVAEVIFGIVQSFDKDNTTAATLLYEVSPDAQSLPTNELTITFDNTDAKYNLANPTGLYAYLQQGQRLDAELGINGEYINMGRFYFANVAAQDGSMTAQITAYDRLYLLDRSICRIGATGTWTVAEAVGAVIADSGLPIATDMPAIIGARVINKCIPPDTSHREALRLIAQAGRCTCFVDRSGTLVFSEVAVSAPVDTLNNDNMRTKARISVLPRINTVELTVRDEYNEESEEIVYITADVQPGEMPQVLSVDNALGNQATADWLLAMAQKRVKYALAERGNPAREVADTITIYDAYGGHDEAVITKESYAYNGGLSCETEAVK